MSSLVGSHLLAGDKHAANNRALFRVIILLCIAAAAVASRLFSVIRKSMPPIVLYNKAQMLIALLKQDSSPLFTNSTLGSTSEPPSTSSPMDSTASGTGLTTEHGTLWVASLEEPSTQV